MTQDNLHHLEAIVIQNNMQKIIFLLCLPVLAATRTPIQDNAKFFTKDAINYAKTAIAEVKKLYKKDIIVETVVTVPMSAQGGDVMKDGKISDPAFNKWVQERLTRTGPRNLYLVVSREPSYIMAAVGPETRNKGEFTENDRNQLIQLLADAFRRREYDRGLLDSIHFIRSSIASNLAGVPNVNRKMVAPPPKETAADVTFLWRWIGFGCAALLVLLVVTGLLKGFNNPPKVDEGASA